MSVCLFVCLCVCLFVCHTFSLRLTVFLPQLPEVQCPNFLDFWNLWGKVMERSGLRFENFCSYRVKSCRAKKDFLFFFFFVSFALPAGFFWYRCYYPHWSRDSLSSVCGIFNNSYGNLMQPDQQAPALEWKHFDKNAENTCVHASYLKPKGFKSTLVT